MEMKAICLKSILSLMYVLVDNLIINTCYIHH